MHTNSELSLLVCACMWLFAAVLPPCSPSRGAMSGGGDSCNTMCPYVCCVYCPDPVWIPSVHACVDLSFVSSRLNIRMSLMLGSIPNASPWHGVWHWLMEDTTPARGALASANATRTPELIYCIES